MITVLDPPFPEPGVVEAVGGGFPTVDSRRLGDSDAIDAFARLNVSAVTTSKYAHPGTAVTGLIVRGYLSSDVNPCLRINE